MRTIKYMIFAAALTLLGGCESWFDVSPKTQVKQKDMFSSEAGFRDALYGIYTTMTSPGAYGGSRTISTLDVIAQVYSPSQVGDFFSSLQKWEYMNNDYARRRIDSLWNINYQCIANCNEILANIDGKQGLFRGGIYQMVKAEAMGLRAMLLFDVLRTFGPIPSAANLDKPAVPIYTEVTPVAQPQSTTAQVVDFVIEEMDRARKLIEPFDPIGPAFDSYTEGRYSIGFDNMSEEDFNNNGFKLFRRGRMNYYAMTAVMARAALWGGRTEEAARYAREVIDSGRFPLMTEQHLNQETSIQVWLCENEYISAVCVPKMKSEIFDIYYNRDEWESQTKLYITKNDLNALFGSDKDFDWRATEKFYKMNSKGYYVPMKYSVVGYIGPYVIPLMKIAEMYYILAEATGDIGVLDELRDHRGYANKKYDEGTSLDDALLAEYRREFIAEGCMFYYYKRRGIFSLPQNKKATESVFELPLPDDEIEFGNIVNQE